MNITERITRMRERNPFISNTDIAYDVILECILDGELACGEGLNQEGLAASLGISRTPVRDALALLEKEGFVIKEKNGHYKVYELELNDCLDFTNFRKCIEGYSAYQAAEYATSSELKKMAETLESLKKAEAERDFSQFLVLDGVFHKQIIDAAKNKYIAEIYEQHMNKLSFYRRMLLNEENLQYICKKHEQILHWIMERNGENARAAMENHVTINLKMLTK